VDGSYWCRVRWYMIPEETSVGRQPHNLSRELYRTNDLANIEVIIVNDLVVVYYISKVVSVNGSALAVLPIYQRAY